MLARALPRAIRRLWLLDRHKEVLRQTAEQIVRAILSDKTNLKQHCPATLT